LTTTEKLLCRHNFLRFHFKVEHPFIANLCRPKVIAHEVERWYLVPWRRDGLLDRQGFKTILHQLELSGSVISERCRDRRKADFLIIDINQCPRRIAADGHSSLHATDLQRAENDSQ